MSAANAIQRIYLDYNATTPLDATVIKTISSSLNSDWGNPSSLCPEGIHAKKVITTARKEIADGISALETDIVFTSGGTEANNWVIATAIEHFHKSNSLHETGDSRAKPHFISTTVEHDAISLPLIHLQGKGKIDVTFVPINPEYGVVMPKDVMNAVRPNTCLVSVMMANNETGTIMPIGEISKVVKGCNSSILIHTDAAQAIGKVPVDVRSLGVDYLTIVGHKIYGPRNGALYVKDLLQENGAPLYTLFHGGGQERNLRPGTENTPMIAGLGKAVAIACEGVDNFAENMRKTRDHLERRLKEEFSESVVFNCASVPRLPNTSSVAFIGGDLQGFKLVKRIQGFSCSTGSACHANECKPSRILLNFHIPSEIAANTLRISTGRDTTISKIEEVIVELKLLILK